ncbi:hypothetical protein B2G71_02915 [Novosphingobium sp. PC22D]|uniref:hypothetical protein n=1 Tax=Novosphingobium sp. PC22D TaxID=1962403 RepID=UPI000BF21A3E|nr:hypothetical protein [Novosphingobium sp. PC22D]PEQ14544.1 hypothetical protein B2G71_02915 [Novosphingobium sp. PC22D]
MRFAKMALLGLTALTGSAGSQGSLEDQCRSTEVAVPASCGCTVRKAQEAGVGAEQLAALFKDDGASAGVDQATYSRFWMIKTQCIGEAGLAGLGITPGNPLPGASAPRAPAPAAAAVAPDPRPSAPTAPQRKVRFAQETAKLRFTYDFPDEVAALPGMGAYLDKDRIAAFARASSDARGFRLTSHLDKQEHDVWWVVTGRAGRLVSLTRAVAANEGGAHPNRDSSSLLWDAEAGKPVTLDEIFPGGAFAAQMRGPYCNALEDERVRRTGQQPEERYFNVRCPPFSKLAITYKDGKWLFHAPPYVAGSYAEGDYLIELAPTPDLVAAAAPEYRGVFGAPSGKVAPDIAARIGGIELEPPHFAAGTDCVAEAFRLAGEAGEPSYFEDYQALVKRSPERIFAHGGPLGGDDWRGGILLDGTFLRVEEAGFDWRKDVKRYRGSGIEVVIDLDTSYTRVSEGKWGVGTLIVTAPAGVARIPIVYQSWQCT